jgi:hypothetical protein
MSKPTARLRHVIRRPKEREEATMIDKHSRSGRQARGKRRPDGFERVAVENIIRPGAVRSVDAAKYRAMRRALLMVLPSRPPGLTLEEARTAVLPHLSRELFPGGARAGWWFKTVQLDLEAKRTIARVKTSPLRVHRVRSKQG